MTIQDPATNRPSASGPTRPASPLRDLFQVGRRLPSIWRVWVRGELDPTLREEVMLTVARGSRLPHELILASSYVLGTVPVALMLSVRRRTAPHRLARKFLRLSERSELPVAS